VLHLTFDFYSNSYNFYFKYKTYEFDFSISDIEGVETFLRELSFKEIFVNSLVSFKDTARILALMKELTEISNAELVIPIHDYYPVCPNYTLLNEKSEFCEVPSLERCRVCMQYNDLEWKTFGNENADVSVWRNDWKALLDTATKIICFSNSSKEILKRAYSDLENKKIVIIPHTVKALPAVLVEESEAKEEITVGVLGAINLAKGAGILNDLVKTIEEQNLKINIVLIGEISEFIKSEHFHVTGRYEREALPQLIKEHEIDIFLLPSICPETFSYTTQEIMMMNMPLMVFDLAAPAERIIDYS
jgi:glycosyltransferase involved in cell wall biosynthesis